jgi:hypothetical protein
MCRLPDQELCECSFIDEIRADERVAMTEGIQALDAFKVGQEAYALGREDAIRGVNAVRVSGIAVFNEDQPLTLAERVKARCVDAAVGRPSVESLILPGSVHKT